MTSRASLIQVPSPSRRCRYCGKLITAGFKRLTQAVAVNVYQGKWWSECFISHSDCYESQGQPYGEPQPRKPKPKTVGRRVE